MTMIMIITTTMMNTKMRNQPPPPPPPRQSHAVGETDQGAATDRDKAAQGDDKGAERNAQELEEQDEEVEEGEVVEEGQEEGIGSDQGTAHQIQRGSPLTPASPAYRQEVHETKKWQTAAVRMPSPMFLQELAGGRQPVNVPVPR